MSKKQIQDKYDESVKIVKKIIDKWDPANLFPDAPDDEYEVEISRIVVILNKAETVDILAEGIALVFNKAFELKFTKNDCFSVAHDIWDEMKVI